MTILEELCEILGWQGGTIHDALKEVRRLKNYEKEAGEAIKLLKKNWKSACGAYGEASELARILAEYHVKAMEPPPKDVVERALIYGKPYGKGDIKNG